MNIWLIQTGEDIPFGDNLRKLRTAVLAEELAARGHQVKWWAAAFSHLRKEWVVTKETRCKLASGVEVELLRGTGYRKNISLARIIDHRVVAWQFRRRSSSLPVPDIIVCGFPPYDLAYQVAKYANRHRTRLIVDARDYWPDIFLTAAPSMFRPALKLALWREFQMARQVLHRADSITAMSEDMLSWALTFCERERSEDDRVFHLGFRPISAGDIPTPPWLEALKHRFVVAFVGTFSRHHNPLILVDVARRLLAARRDDIAIVLAGAGGDFHERVVSAAKGLPNITLPGWLEQDAIGLLLDHSAIGVCATNIDARFFPNKTFLYFSKGLPVLSAYQGELRMVLDEDGLGRYFDRGDADALTSHIIEFCDNKNYYEKSSKRVRAAFEERYSEQTIYTAFADHVESIADGSFVERGLT